MTGLDRPRQYSGAGVDPGSTAEQKYRFRTLHTQTCIIGASRSEPLPSGVDGDFVYIYVYMFIAERLSARQ